jgi:hypothetical protein
MVNSLTNEENHTNIDLIYEYTESVFKNISDNIDKLNTRLTTVIGFSGILLRFAADLPNRGIIFDFPLLHIHIEWLSLVLKIGVCLSLLLCVCLSAWGLAPKKGAGTMVPPGKLLDEWYYETDERCKLYIAKSWRVGIEQLDSGRLKKAQNLNLAVWLLIVATILFAVDIAISAIFKIPIN